MVPENCRNMETAHTVFSHGCGEGRGTPGGLLGIQGNSVHGLAGGRGKADQACIMLWLVSLLNRFFHREEPSPVRLLFPVGFMQQWTTPCLCVWEYESVYTAELSSGRAFQGPEPGHHHKMEAGNGNYKIPALLD